MRFQQLALVLWTALAVRAGVPAPQLSDLPAWFEPAEGGRNRFISRGGSVNLEVSAKGATVAPTLRMTVVGGRAAGVEGAGTRSATTNYFIGDRHSQWRSGVSQYDRVKARNVYPGVDLVYYFSGKKLEYDFVLSPGADPSAIGVRFSQPPALTADGGLEFAGPARVRQLAPVAYQEKGGRRVNVDARYELAGGIVRFHLGAYDKSLPLVIDPVLAYASYWGGEVNDAIQGVAATPEGGYWITGTAGSGFYGVDGIDGYSASKKAYTDVFLAKIMPVTGGWQIVEWSYIGGGGDESPAGIVYVKGGGVVVAGSTTSTDFPYAGKPIATANAGNSDAFVFWYEPQWQGVAKLVYSTYYGGAANDFVNAVAVDDRMRIVIAGTTSSSDLLNITDITLQNQLRGTSDAFVAVFEPLAGSASLTFTTYLGSVQIDGATGVAWDKAGMIWFCGYTFGDDFPTTDGAYRTGSYGQGDMFLARIDPTRQKFDAFLYGSYLGGYDLDYANGLSIDSSGRVWLTGYTFSPDLPVTPGAYQPSVNASGDAFLLGIDPAGKGVSFIAYCSYLGGSGGDVGHVVLPLAGGQVAVAGYTYSRDFPLKGVTGFDPPLARQSEAFVTMLDTTRPGSAALQWSGLFGGNNMDVTTGLAVGADGGLAVVGYTGSADFLGGAAGNKLSPGNAYSGFFLQLALTR
jgi:hypothetical protein